MTTRVCVTSEGADPVEAWLEHRGETVCSVIANLNELGYADAKERALFSLSIALFEHAHEMPRSHPRTGADMCDKGKFGRGYQGPQVYVSPEARHPHDDCDDGPEECEGCADAEREPRDPFARRPEDVIPTVMEAKESFLRFVHSHFRERSRADGKETARISIPANPRRDDDLLLSAFIRWAGRLYRASRALRDAPIVDAHNSTATYVRAEREWRAAVDEGPGS